MAKKDYQTINVNVVLFEKQDIVTFSDGASFNVQDYGWWDAFTGGEEK